MEHLRHATAQMAETYYQLFVNRLAYTLQSHRPIRKRDGIVTTGQRRGKGRKAPPLAWRP